MDFDSDLDGQLKIDNAKIKKAIQLQLPVEITTYTLPRNMEIYIRKILETFLQECHQEHMFEYLNFCLGELLTNSKKANTKRVYFKEKNLDINNPADYEKGMETFKDDTLTNIEHYLELQKKAGLYIKLRLQIKGEQIKVEIKNNSKITVFEQNRIQDKIDSVQQYNTIEEVFTNVLDQSEGAGLGIIIIILMLSKIGLSKENFQIVATDTETITRIILPCNQKIFAGNEILSYEFVKMQETVPVLKSVIQQLSEVVCAEKVNRQGLLNFIKKDISLAILLIKNTVNKNTINIKLDNLLALLSDEQIQQIFSASNPEIYPLEDTEQNKQLINHSKHVAFFAYNIAKNFECVQNVISNDDCYTLGLINDFGNLILNNASESQIQYVQELGDQYDDREKITNFFFSGNIAPKINMIYAKKIGLADFYSGALGFWNNCDYIPEKIKSQTYILYMAEILKSYDEGVLEFYQIDDKILEKFEISTEEQFNYILSQLKTVDI